MNIEQSVKVKGLVRAVVRDDKGFVTQDTGFQENIITAAGLAAIAGLVGNTGAITAFSYLAVGTDSTAPVIGNTTLGAELTTLGLGRSAATVSRISTSQTNDTLQLAFTWSVTGSTTVQEAGIFNAVSSGTMLGRKLTGALALQNGYSLSITYKIQFS